jgi:predicted  nucleic acid-binding Zn-ribbon protein
MKTLALSTLILFCLNNSVSAQGLPDEIDIPRYRSLFNVAIVISYRLLGEANAQSAIVAGTQSEIDDSLDGIDRARADISESERSIERLAIDNQNLVSEIRRLLDYANRLDSENANLSRELSSTRSERERVLRDLGAARNLLNNLLQEFNRAQSNRIAFNDAYERSDRQYSAVESNLRNAQSQVDSLSRDIQDAQRQVDELQRQLPALDQRLAELSNRERPLQNEISNRERELSRLESEIPGLSSEVERRRAALSNAESGLAPLRQRVEAARSQVSSIESRQSSISAEISNLRSRIQGLERDGQAIPGQISEANAQISSLRSRQGEIAGEVNTLEARIDYSRNEISKNEQEISRLSSVEQTPEVQREIRKLTNQNTSLKTVMARTLKEIEALNRESQAVPSKIAALESKVRDLETRRSGLGGQISQLQSQISSKESERNALNSSLAQARSGLSQAESAYAQASSSLNSFKEALAHAIKALENKRAQVSNAQSGVQASRRDFQSTQNEVREVASRRRDVEVQIPQRVRELDAYRIKLSHARSQVTNLSRDLERARQDLAVALKNLENAQRLEERALASFQAQEQTVRAIEAREQSLASHESELSDTISRNQSDAGNARTMSSRHQETIANNEQQSRNESNSIVANQRAIASFESAVTRLRQRIVGEQRDLDARDAKAKQALGVTASALSELQKRERLYADHLASARSLGGAQGRDNGRLLGLEAGSVLAEVRGREIGQRIGAEAALLDGFFRGLIRGKLAGNGEGYAAGVDSPEDYELGLKEGIVLGKRRALDTARAEDYPRAYREVRTTRLAATPSERVVLDNGENKELVLLERIDFFGSDNKSLDETEISEDELREANALASAVNAEVDRTRAHLDDYGRPERNLSVPSLVYTAPTTVPVDNRANCQPVYRGVSDFVNACKQAYSDSLASSFREAHRESFGDDYSGFYTDSFENSFALSRNQRFSEGRALAHKTVFAEAFSRGAVVAKARGVKEGEVKGYSDSIAAASTQMAAEGRASVTSFFDRNGVIRNAGAGSLRGLDPRGALQGTKLAIDLKLANLGKVASTLGAVVAEFTVLTDNIRLERAKVALRGLPARKLIDLRDVTRIQIADNARPGSAIRLKVKLNYPGDELNASFSEELEISGTVKVNPEVGAQFANESEVNYRKWTVWPFSWKFATHEIKVTLKGLRDFVPAGHTVELQVLSGGELITVNTPSITTAPIGLGQVVEVPLSYTFKAKAEEKELGFKVVIRYQSEVLHEQLIRVKTK